MPRARAYKGEVLSAREREVLKLVISGLSVREVAAGIGITEASIRRHIRSGLAKLDSSRTAAPRRSGTVRAGLRSSLNRFDGQRRMLEDIALAIRAAQPVSVVAVRLHESSEEQREAFFERMSRNVRRDDLVVRWDAGTCVVVLIGARRKDALCVARRLGDSEGGETISAVQLRRGERVSGLMERLFGEDGGGRTGDVRRHRGRY